MPKSLRKVPVSAVPPEAIRPLVEAFLTAMGADYSATRFGREAANNPNLVMLIRGGREVQTPGRIAIAEAIERKRPGFVQQFLARLAS